ncbi:DUF5134 domain-containing protein [Arthrobacter terricola]|uniref:DUF5134 domain-containing protein n=1 Tax=Arthrobacter terricola TaxID=2547396 RepID=A0A4R5JZH5_9MICC|nr:DUF5134 domain-containing protein [Arthrobacter terricola]TDF82666.1 DUF5134 domain-containing protein [Arthrobacter terricola]
MILVFEIPAVSWALTAVLSAAGAYHLYLAARARKVTDRINEVLHALMHAAMAAMIWNLAPAALLAQIGVLAAAALWFTLQAIARPEYKLLCTGTQGRITCAYHAATMAAAAFMLTIMNTTSAGNTATGNTGAGNMPQMNMGGMVDMGSMPMNHHTTTPAAATSTANPLTALFAHQSAPALILAILFGTAAITFTTLLLRRQPTTGHGTHGNTHNNRTKHALEATGAATMALMFATMTS